MYWPQRRSWRAAKEPRRVSLLRLALSGDGDRGDAGSLLVAGFRPFRAANPKLITNEQIDQLRDQDGL